LDYISEASVQFSFYQQEAMEMLTMLKAMLLGKCETFRDNITMLILSKNPKKAEVELDKIKNLTKFKMFIVNIDDIYAKLFTQIEAGKNGLIDDIIKWLEFPNKY